MVDEERFVDHADQDLAGAIFTESEVGADGWKVMFEVVDVDGRPIRGVRVVQKVPGVALPLGDDTDQDGKVYIKVFRSDAVFEVHAKHSYWSAYVGSLDRSGPKVQKIVLQTLEPEPGYQWDYREMGIDGSAPPWMGREPFRVGMLDTGISDHPDLPANIRGKNFVEADGNANWRADYHRHGTLIAGIISAGGNRPGYVPEAELSVYRVFPRVGSASTIDIARAITQAADDRIDVLCLALSSQTSNIGLIRPLEYALTKGVMVCAATGNDAREVGWPAACGLANVISVGAFGRIDVIRPNTIFEQAISDYRSTGFFHAAFSNRGKKEPPRVDVIAPGVACISTVSGGYAAAQGTSIAAAHVTGLLAFAMMRRSEVFDQVPRGRERVELIRQWLLRSCREFKWGFEREGNGRPDLRSMLTLMEMRPMN